MSTETVTGFLLACRKDSDSEANAAHARTLEALLTPSLGAVDVWPSDAWWHHHGGQQVGYRAWIESTVEDFDHLVVLVDAQYPSLGRGNADLIKTFLAADRGVYAYYADREYPACLVPIIGQEAIEGVSREEAFFRWATAIEGGNDE